MSDNNTFDKEKEEKGLEELKQNLKTLESELTNMAKSMGEVSNFNDLSEEIAKLKTMGKPNKDIPVEGLTEDDFGTEMDTTPPPIDGETCMHGNSWNSNCSDCDDLDNIEVVLNEMADIIDNEPNDTKLGKKIRDFYNKYQEFNEDNSDNTNNIDI
tara:strand:- start:214 stop:681 length:468 start_codon:yes stop_codon:yes gene_type:complete